MAGGVALTTVAYAMVVATTWYRHGRVALASSDELDPLLDQFMPEYEVAERHHVRVAAPAAITLSAAVDTDLQESTIIRAIIKTRELVLGAEPDPASQPRGLLAEVTSLGWRVLAEKPGREIVVGAVTQPWRANVVFRGLPPQDFKAFREPGYVKIVWTLRANPIGPAESIFRTETRVATTDPSARTRFRWYWARFSPGIVLIRRVLLSRVKADAERRARQATRGVSGQFLIPLLRGPKNRSATHEAIGGRSGEREPDGHYRPAICGTVDFYRPVVCLDETLRNRQAKSAAARLGGKEGCEDLFSDLR